MRLKNIAAIIPVMLIGLILLSACSNGGGDASQTNTNPPPTPNGVLLPGADDDNAMAKTLTLPPTPVDPSQIKTNGFLSTRLDAVINPAATVAEVNAALESVGAKIDGMTTNDPTVILVISEVADRAAAQAIADTLQASDAFFFVTVTFEAKPIIQSLSKTVTSLLPTALRVSAQQAPSLPYDWYQAAHFPALSRADAVANAVNQPVTIIIPSTYAADITTDSSNIPNRSFLDGILGDGSLVDYGSAETDPVAGSFGYSIASIVGIDDSTSLTSAYPETGNNLLRIDSAPLSGLSYAAAVMAIANSVRDSISSDTINNKIILLTDFVYLDDDFSERDRIWRAIDALNWRRAGGNFLHVAAVGELGGSTGPASQAKYSSPFAVSEAYSDLSQLLTEDPTLDFSSDAVAEFVELRFTLSNPPAIGNLLTVGSSRIDQFTRSDFSTPGADVRMVGEDVIASCYTNAETCVDGQWLMSDTGVAAAQVAALAAWMLNMDPTLNESGVISAIKHAYQNGQLVGLVDTYAALLSLDTSILEAPIRKSILDVTDTLATGVRDGIFDEGDISFWLNTILPTFPDGTPFDLNGDGHIGGSGTAWFDLDINPLPVYTTLSLDIGSATRTIDEHAVTDLDVLCYYAYSDIYSGDTDRRDALLHDECSPGMIGDVVLELNSLEPIMSGNSTFISGRAGIRVGGDLIDYRDGINIRISGGDVSINVPTETDGTFNVAVSPLKDAGLVSYLVLAQKDIFTQGTTDVAILTIISSNADIGPLVYDGRANNSTAPALKLRDTDGSITDLEITLTSHASIKWSPTGEKIAFTAFSGSNQDIFTINPNGSGLTNVTNDANSADSFPTWAPNGAKFAYMSVSKDASGNNVSEVFSINSNGSGKTVLPGYIATDLPNSFWSPDGNHILIAGSVDGVSGVVSHNLVDGSEDLIVPFISDGKSISSSQFEWSSNGAKILFVSNQDTLLSGGTPEIYTVSANGSGQQRLTTSTAGTFITRPAWSPNGSMIAYYSKSGGAPANLMLVKADGSGQRILVKAVPDPGWSPRWSPDSSRVIFGPGEITFDGTSVIPAVIDGGVNLINIDGTGLVRLTSPIEIPQQGGIALKP